MVTIMEIYKDSSYSIEERAKNLLSLMTLDEKIDQMHLYNDPDLRYEEIKAGKVEHDFAQRTTGVYAKMNFRFGW